jgi:hypothetical protein
LLGKGTARGIALERLFSRETAPQIF